MFDQLGLFANRIEAGRLLADQLFTLLGNSSAAILVLALPRGGVPVAAPVAQRLGAPLDLCLVRKLGVPGHEELAFGAIATGGCVVYNDNIRQLAQITDDVAKSVEAKERAEMDRREQVYRQGRPSPSVAGKTVIIVDGIATGATMRVACRCIRAMHPNQLIIATPVGAPETIEQLRGEADQIVCLSQPTSLRCIGQWYQVFGQTSDQEVIQLLEMAHATHHSSDTTA